jgi:Asp/Glu/hydantoin racemase
MMIERVNDLRSGQEDKVASSRRILLLHAYRPSMEPAERAFKESFPGAEILNILDESLYADVSPDGLPSPGSTGRLRTLFQHCANSGAEAVVFTASTFGPLVEAARAGMTVPVLKSDEAMVEAAVQKGNRIVVICTAERALPVISRNVASAAHRAGVERSIPGFIVAGARDAISRGDGKEHDRLVATQVKKAVIDFDVVVVGQISMTTARASLPSEVAARVITAPYAAAAKLLQILT